MYDKIRSGPLLVTYKAYAYTSTMSCGRGSRTGIPLGQRSPHFVHLTSSIVKFILPSPFQQPAESLGQVSAYRASLSETGSLLLSYYNRGELLV